MSTFSAMGVEMPGLWNMEPMYHLGLTVTRTIRRIRHP